ncbi:hypothetical protein E3E31_11530 [Thermococcus sp. M39]|uniref:ABC transporter permease n=1 Tax=unclassified Thermococcus TaxID=2627626 RepID=UPI00143B354D|nr:MULTISPECIES: ABC transporter permease [unclassified Thermococcus]NJE09144.1 hypothetical protein [Thermococcus sp. M39]NJE13063.1 hypothetical protein [Thermococcus sp. LS2]
MRQIKQAWIITKTTFKNWIRYPENIFGMFLYLGIVAVVGYAFSLSKGILSINAVPYYTVGLLIYSILSQQNGVYIQFGIWKEDILSKPIKPDIFLFGTFFGGLLTTSLPSIMLFMFVFIIYKNAFVIINPVILGLALILGILSAVGVSYIFASLGLRFRPEGMVVTIVTFLISILSGIMIPIYALPEKVRVLSYLIPYTWAIDLFRYSLLGTETILPTNDELKYLLLSVLVTIVLGKLYLHYTINAIRKKKVIIR